MASGRAFLIVYSYNCDGGRQEFQAASDVVKGVFPDASVEARPEDTYPVRVSIQDVRTGKVIWKGDQRDLFKKYGHRAVPEIREALLAFSQEIGSEDGN